MTAEITVILKDSERTYKQKFLAYDAIALSITDPYINECVKEAQKNFQGDPEDVVIKTMMVFK